jgi:hypothetical protein
VGPLIALHCSWCFARVNAKFVEARLWGLLRQSLEGCNKEESCRMNL